MNIGVWGAGTIGEALVCRLPTLPFVAEVHWFNRSYDKIVAKGLDVLHGRNLMPTCRDIVSYHAEDRTEGEQFAAVIAALKRLDVVVLTHGMAVAEGATRQSTYHHNRDLYRSFALPALIEARFSGIVVVVGNPVDLMSRLVHIEANISDERVLGLGTVVETTRLRYFLQDLVGGNELSFGRDLWAYAVGTHDENFVPLVPDDPPPGANVTSVEWRSVVEMARKQVVEAANEVKKGGAATRYPIVEGCVQVLEAIAYDRRSIWTTSVLAPEMKAKPFYSVPCAIGRSGVFRRFGIDDGDGRLNRCIERLLELISAG